MAILAIDSSETTASVAIVSEEKILCEMFLNAGLTHSQTLLPMVKSALDLVQNVEIEKIAVTVGPGSFTGVRIGVAAAKGLAFTENKACVEVSSLEALAYNVNQNCTICVMFDARLKRVYTAMFKCENGIITRLTEDDCLSFEQLHEVLCGVKGDLIILGDGVKAFTLAFEQYKNNAIADAENYIKASAVAFASKNNNELEASQINPKYLQVPQAQRERLERLKQSEDNK